MVSAETKLLSHDEIIRRLIRLTGPRYVRRPNEITRFDVAKWFDVDERFVRMHATKVKEISDFWQFAYTQFFVLVDAGLIEIQFNDQGHKTLVRLAKPKAAVKKTLRPWVDLTTMQLRLDT